PARGSRCAGHVSAGRRVPGPCSLHRARDRRRHPQRLRRLRPLPRTLPTTPVPLWPHPPELRGVRRPDTMHLGLWFAADRVLILGLSERGSGTHPTTVRGTAGWPGGHAAGSHTLVSPVASPTGGAAMDTT